MLSSLTLDDQVLKQSTLDHIAFLFNQFPIKYSSSQISCGLHVMIIIMIIITKIEFQHVKFQWVFVFSIDYSRNHGGIFFIAIVQISKPFFYLIRTDIFKN